MEASEKGCKESVEALLHRGAQVNITDNVSSSIKAMRCLLLMYVLVVCVTDKLVSRILCV